MTRDNKPGASAVPGEYMELNDQAYKVVETTKSNRRARDF